MGERQFGPYRLVRQIAVGGMAEIHLAKTKGIAGFEKYVALKMIHPNFAEDDQFIQMLVDEAKIAVQLTHGNIAQTFDLGRVGETYYITMEFVDGADLYKILRRGSEADLEMPLDVCAFVGKEVASALDHAHRKRDHLGRTLGIVHRDVSPQNVLVSFSGEVKLVDFGIAKATMKARQTAVGVIKGKYYYMSPEQAWGDPIDYRSDIFSAGIVLYEMITGQMLYLEEDLHKLLDMARKADIAPPNRLRKGVPPQLERIVMHALAKDPSERYQSAGDFATDLERFLHAYSPVFTAAKLATLVKQIVGDPIEIPLEQGFPSVEVRDGPMSTHALSDADLVHAKDELHDENSVIFRVDELGEPITPPSEVAARPAPRTTRTTEPPPAFIAAPKAALRGATPAKASPVVKRQLYESTRPLEPLEDDTSAVLPQTGKRLPWDASDPDDLDNVGEHTLITGAPKMSQFIGEGDEGIDATIVTQAPSPYGDSEESETDLRPNRTHQQEVDPDDEDGPTMSRDFVARPALRAAKGNTQSPPALAAKIHAPAVSELRKPRTSRRTPPGGVPHNNVLQQLVGGQASEPMPSPRSTSRPSTPPPTPTKPTSPPPYQATQPASTLPYPTGAIPYPPQYQLPTAPPQYTTDASGLPLGIPTPPSGMPAAQPAPYQGVAPGYPAQNYSSQGYPQMTPGALYQFHPQGQPPPQPMSLTGQLRLFEADELPSQYKLDASRRRWFTYIVAGVLAISVAAGMTFFIIRTTREKSPTMGSVHVDSVPPGAEVVFDGTRLTDKTPLTVDGVPVGSRHDVRVELAHHKPYVDTIDVPKTGGEVPVMAQLAPITGKLVIDSQPAGAEIRINDQLRGRTPTTITDLDMTSAKHLELRLKEYQVYAEDLTWPANGQIDRNVKLQPAR